MIEKLKETLIKQIDSIKKLLQLLEEQHEYIIANDVFQLEGIIPKLKEANREIAIAESERRQLVGNKSMNVVINESSDKELEEYYHKCIMTLESAKTQKESNEILIKQCLGYTNSMLNMLKPRENNNVYNSYGKIRK
ncbi:MAG: flagellar protein FlgN [Clostridium argentinense]|uniref:Flagellar protein FlgN n=1 Tax=Clostridium faecium TaxID=2762223 RepID=A0ABR8YP06_9CLOT|nr:MULTISPECIES: flagellar protein FlgN [Clostridium]MBD8045965.1 flagellar protein FlgN [Clostridium faecium]MBS5823920.1 flagellar protein FlgN [Clostridium argentinense]MDU1349515.1 flagellar protein FlgN [Clostridium argentinense]